MSRIIVLGAKGMLGRALVQAWPSHEVAAWDREELDITNAKDVLEKITEQQPQIVINAAAYTDVDGAQENREDAFRVNELGVRNVALAAKQAGAKLVHFSTDYVFPGDKDSGYLEDDVAGPALNVYGESKLAGEKALAETGSDYFLIRTAWLYGAHGKNFVETMLALGETRKEIAVVNDQHGSPTYAKDLAQFSRELAEGRYNPGIYHAVNTGVTTWFEFACRIFELAGKKVTVKPVTSQEFVRPAKRPNWSFLKNTKGPGMRPWEEALEDYLRIGRVAG